MQPDQHGDCRNGGRSHKSHSRTHPSVNSASWLERHSLCLLLSVCHRACGCAGWRGSKHVSTRRDCAFCGRGSTESINTIATIARGAITHTHTHTTQYLCGHRAYSDKRELSHTSKRKGTARPPQISHPPRRIRAARMKSAKWPFCANRCCCLFQSTLPAGPLIAHRDG